MQYLILLMTQKHRNLIVSQINLWVQFKNCLGSIRAFPPIILLQNQTLVQPVILLVLRGGGVSTLLLKNIKNEI